MTDKYGQNTRRITPTERTFTMENNNVNRKSTRNESRVNQSTKLSPVMEVVCGVVSVATAVLIWLFSVAPL